MQTGVSWRERMQRRALGFHQSQFVHWVKHFVRGSGRGGRGRQYGHDLFLGVAAAVTNDRFFQKRQVGCIALFELSENDLRQLHVQVNEALALLAFKQLQRDFRKEP